jgi:hypothetical protein
MTAVAKAQTQTGGKAIRAAFADAKRAKDEADALYVIDPDPNLPRDGIKPGQWPGAPFDNMPPDCPVKVVGRDSEGIVYCISTTGHLRKIERWDMPALSDLFAPKLNTMFWSWPGFGKKKVLDEETGEMAEKLVVNRVERDKAMMAIINEAARKPDFDPHTQHAAVAAGWTAMGASSGIPAAGCGWSTARSWNRRGRPSMTVSSTPSRRRRSSRGPSR